MLIMQLNEAELLEKVLCIVTYLSDKIKSTLTLLLRKLFLSIQDPEISFFPCLRLF